MGQLLGVNKMFTGSIGKVGTTYVINLKIINVESGKIDRAEAEMAYSEDQLLPATQNLAKKMAGLATQPLAGQQPQAKTFVEPQQPEKITPPGSLGANITSITDNFARSFGLSVRDGALVLGVVKESTADKAQVKKGDVITGFNGTEIKSSFNLISLISKTLAGDNVKLKVLRGGKEITIETVMQKAVSSEEVSCDFFGLTVLDTRDGFLITGIKKGTFDGNSEVEVGDMIKEINGQEFNYIADFYSAITMAGSSAGLLVERGNAPVKATVSMIEKIGIGAYWALTGMSGGSLAPGFTLCNYAPDDPGNNMEMDFRFWKSASGLNDMELILGYPFVFVYPIKTYTVTLFLGGNCRMEFGDIPGFSDYFGTDIGFLAKSGVEFFAGPAGFFFEGGVDVIMLGLANWTDAANKDQKTLRSTIDVYFPISAGVRFYF